MRLLLKKLAWCCITAALVLPVPVFAAGARSRSTAPVVQTDPSMLVPFSKYPELIHLSSARVMNRGNQLLNGETTSNNVMIDVVREKLNVQIDIAWETSPDQYAQRLALSIAGGDLPDIFMIDKANYLTFNALVDNNALADLTEPYNKSIGGIAAEWIQKLNGAHLPPVTRNGKIYAVAAPPTGYNYNLLWVRKDWLDRVGMAPPKTLDEIKAVALAFQRARLGGPNTIGIVTDPVVVLGESTSFLSLSSVANAVNAYPRSWIKDRNGQVVYGSVAPEMKDALAVLADWYQAGVLDPQFMTYQNMDAVTPAIREGRTGMYFGAYWSPWTVADTMVQDAQMEWVYVMGPVDSAGRWNHVNPMESGSFLAVSANCRYPEAVIKAANVLHQLENGGYNDDPDIVYRYSRSVGGRTVTPVPSPLANDFDHEIDKGRAIANYITTGTLTMPAGSTPTDREDAEKAYAWYKAPDRNDTAGYSIYNSFMSMNDVANNPNDYAQPIAFGYTTVSMADYWGALFTLETETIVQIISGQRPVSYFDEFVRTWKSSGGDIITREVSDIVNRQ
jgi:putative aldouronate transport system substrate-binding protein